MAGLLIELWHSVFDHLQLTDLSACAKVSKRFYFIVKEYRIRELAFTLRVHWWFHYGPANYRYRVDFANAAMLSRSSFNLDYLKRLKIGRRSSIDRCSSIDLRQINKFVQLEELDIELEHHANMSRTLSLANLKVLYLDKSKHVPSLVLDTPRLAKVCTFSLERLNFRWPESVRCVETFVHAGKLTTFTNLEYLLFTDRYKIDESWLPPASARFEEFNVIDMKKLKEIDFFYEQSNVGHQSSAELNLSKIRKFITNTLALQLPNLQMYWMNVRLTSIDLLNEYTSVQWTEEWPVAFQMRHCKLLKETVPFKWCHYFNELISGLSAAGINVRDEQFISKYSAQLSFGKIIACGRIKEHELLLQLIAGSPNLLSLLFSNSDLSESFYDRMAEVIWCNRIPLRYLRFCTPTEDLTFDFLAKLRDLQLLEIDHKPSAELLTKLLRLPSLTDVEFHRSQSSKIQRLSANKFLLNGKLLSVHQLLKCFDHSGNSAMQRIQAEVANLFQVFSQ